MDRRDRHRAGAGRRSALALAALIGALGCPACAGAEESDGAPPAAKAQVWAVHVQATFVNQLNAAFTSPYAGQNSLAPQANGRETFDATLYLGVRPWRGAEVWINPEVDQGFGLSNTLGVAGFPSAEAYKVGSATPYLRLQRLFLRQSIDLSGETQTVEADLNQLGGTQRANRLVLTIGKMAVTDTFDTNRYAHDPRHDLLNWTLIDAGTFDYAADAWGYSLGATAEWYQGPWTLRGGVFALSSVPNSETLDTGFGQFQMLGEVERRYTLGGQPGVLKVTGFLSRGRMGLFKDAIALADLTHQPADIAAVRQYRSRGGMSVNWQQQVAADIGVFARGGVADGDVEPYEFTDVDRTLSAGISVAGKRWGRAGDTVALAGVVNAVTAVHQQFLNAGGLGILIGDGKLPNPGDEYILETSYDTGLGRYVHVALDYQFVENPAYNRDRGPVSIVAVRLHAQF